jgi:ubiquinone/menaquinone biosynthesis C-methylase UbiE
MNIEEKTGQLYGDLWPQYDGHLYAQSVDLFAKRWAANGEDLAFFQNKYCLDAGCGGGRYSFAMAKMGAAAVVGVDISATGLDDARRRGDSLGYTNVLFQQGSVLDLPFPDSTFDFVCCSGVLHHTPAVDRGLFEIHRVLKPGGSAYLLLYGSGGMFWPLNYLLRALARVLGRSEVERYVAGAGYAASKRRAVVDDLFVPILETYSAERIAALLKSAGFIDFRTWQGERMDHESDASSLLAEVELRAQMWQVGVKIANDPANSSLVPHGVSISLAVVSAIRALIEEYKAKRITQQQLHDAVIGDGHHRVIAVKNT